MQKSRVKRIVSAGLVALLTTTQMLGCAQETATVEIKPMEAEESNAVSPSVIGGKDVMPLSGYYGPYVSTNCEDGQTMPDYYTDEIWQAIADCGINLILYSTANYKSSPDEVKKNLDFGEKYNIGIVVRDYNILDMTVNDEEITLEKVTEYLSEYMNHPAFAGAYLIDEPGTSYFHPEQNERWNLKNFTELGPMLFQELGIFTYAQAYPSTGGQNEHDRYEQYIREYYEVLQPTYLLYDRYPFDKVNEGKIDDHFYDLSIIRKVAQDNDIPFWAYIGAGSQWNEGTSSGTLETNGYYPEEGQFDWHVNTCLAFGMQGMVFFPLIQPYHFTLTSTSYDFERNGVLGAMGNKNRWWYYIQDITKHVEVIDEVLMNSVNKGVLVYGEQAKKDVAEAKEYGAILEGSSWRELRDVTGDAMVGCFNYQGKTALYVVNYSTEYAQKIDLTFQDTYNVTVIQDAEIKNLQGAGITLDMVAGEGVLLVFE